jgi:hypothetical protein
MSDKKITEKKKINKKILIESNDSYNNNYDDNNNMNNSNDENLTYSLIRNSLEYYDKYQPDIQKIINKIEYIKIIDGININDQYIFYDSNDKEIFKSRIETLSIYIPQTNTWKWSWSVPFVKYRNTLISRKILEYAFTLNTSSDLILKSTLINSNITIANQNQIDIYLGLASKLSKIPFILELYLFPLDNKGKNNIYYYREINKYPDKNNFISVFVFIIDWVPNI